MTVCSTTYAFEVAKLFNSMSHFDLVSLTLIHCVPHSQVVAYIE